MPSAEVEEPGRHELGRVAGFVRQVVAPTTALTALLLYFGWARTSELLLYFGVSSSVFGFTARDYLLDSVDGVFVPLAVLAVLTVVLVWSRALLPRAPGAVTAALSGRRVRVALLVLGAVLTLVGLATVASPFLQRRLSWTAPLLLVAGVLVLAWTVHRRADGQPSAARPAAEWAAVSALVAIGAFWFATDYARAVGQTRARELAVELPRLPAVTVFSQQVLPPVAGVDETGCSAGSTYVARYDGFRLLVQSGGYYLLVPAGWTRSDGAAVLLPRSEATLLQFSPQPVTTPVGC